MDFGYVQLYCPTMQLQREGNKKESRICWHSLGMFKFATFACLKEKYPIPSLSRVKFYWGLDHTHSFSHWQQSNCHPFICLARTAINTNCNVFFKRAVCCMSEVYIDIIFYAFSLSSLFHTDSILLNGLTNSDRRPRCTCQRSGGGPIVLLRVVVVMSKTSYNCNHLSVMDNQYSIYLLAQCSKYMIHAQHISCSLVFIDSFNVLTTIERIKI